MNQSQGCKSVTTDTNQRSDNMLPECVVKTQANGKQLQQWSADDRLTVTHRD